MDGGECTASTRFVEPHGATQEVMRMEAAEDEICVRDRDLITAAVTSRAGAGARGERAHLQGSSCIQPGERTAARAGGVDVEHGNTDRKTVYLTFAGCGWFARG